MTEDKKNTINLHLRLLKSAMKEEGMMFGILVDKKDSSLSKLAFVDKEALTNGKTDGVVVGLDELNEGL